MVTAPTALSPLVELLVGLPALVCVGRQDPQTPWLDNAAIAAASRPPPGGLRALGRYPFVEEPGRFTAVVAALPLLGRSAVP
jgi:hypothetical protein